MIPAPLAGGSPTAAQEPVAGLVTLEAIRAAADRIRAAAVRTPLLRVALPGSVQGGEREGAVWLKCESLQPVGAFKIRGAFHFVASLGPETRRAGVVTYSSGNHARAVAWTARRFGIPATVVMPIDAPSIKREAVEVLGARVELCGTTTTERRARAEELLAEVGGTMVPPFDDAAIIAGQGTVGLEIVEQLGADSRRPSVVIVPVGGGGLISGVAAAVRGLVPSARVVGVEPEGAPKMSRSLREGRPVTLEQVETIADGLKPVRPGALTFAHCRSLTDGVATVTDAAIRKAVLWLLRQRLVVEPSGAAGIAALLGGRVTPAEEGETVVVISGGNLDPSLLVEWLA